MLNTSQWFNTYLGASENEVRRRTSSVRASRRYRRARTAHAHHPQAPALSNVTFTAQDPAVQPDRSTHAPGDAERQPLIPDLDTVRLSTAADPVSPTTGGRSSYTANDSMHSTPETEATRTSNEFVEGPNAATPYTPITRETRKPFFRSSFLSVGEDAIPDFAETYEDGTLDKNEDVDDALYGEGEIVVDQVSNGGGYNSFPDYSSDEEKAMDYGSSEDEDLEATRLHDQIVQRYSMNTSRPSVPETSIPSLRLDSNMTASPLSRKNTEALDGEGEGNEYVGYQAQDGGAAGGQGDDPGDHRKRQTVAFRVELSEEDRQANMPKPKRTCKQASRHYARMAWRKLPHYIPILDWLPKYSWRNYLIPDIIAGLAVGIMLIPQGLALASLAGLEPIYGLYTSFIPVVTYVFFGTSRQLSIGPEGVIALLVSTAIKSGEISDQDELVDRAIVLALLVGVICFLLGLFRVGFISSLLSRPLLVGFLNATAVLIILEQVEAIWGTEMPLGDHFHKIQSFFEHFTDIHWFTFMFGTSAIILLYGLEWAKRKLIPFWKYVALIPVLVIVVLLAIFIVWIADLGVPSAEWSEPPESKVLILGKISGGFPVPRIPPFWTKFPDLITELIGSAILISIIGFFEAIIIGKAYGQKHGYPVSANRELCALGMSNILGSVFLSYPSFGSLPRSAVGDMGGAKTQLHGLVAASLVLVAIFLLLPVFYYLPSCVVAAIIIVAASSLFEFRGLLFMYRIRAWLEIFIAFLMFSVAVVFGAQIGVLFSLGLSLFFVVRHTTLPHVSLLGRIGRTRKYRDIAMFPGVAKPIPGLLIFRIDESLYFGNIGQLKDLIDTTERYGSLSGQLYGRSEPVPVRGIIFDLRNCNSMDASAIQTFFEMVAIYKRRGITIAFVRLGEKFRRNFVSAGIIGNLLSPLHFSNHVYAAVEFVQTGQIVSGGQSSYYMVRETGIDPDLSDDDSRSLFASQNRITQKGSSPIMNEKDHEEEENHIDDQENDVVV